MDRILYTTILSFLLATVFGQTQISGIITDIKGSPMIGANIYLKGTYDGGSSNAEGRFTFSTSERDSQTLIVSMIGYKEFLLPIECTGESLSLKISLREAVNRLKAVEISAGAMEASDEKRSVVFKPLDVVTTAGALGDVVGALSTLPGTSVNTNDGRLLVRGGDASETAIFFDGLKVNNAYGSSVSGIPTRTRFSPQLFKGTFFSTGGYSAEFGQALSSVLALNTLDMPIRDQTDLSIMSVGGAISHTEVLKDDAFTVNGNYTNLSPYMDLVPQNLGWEKAPESYNAEALYRHRISKRALLKFYYTHQGSNMLVYQAQPGKEDPALSGVKNRFNYANVSLRQALGDKWILNTGISYSDNRDDFTLDTLKARRFETLLHAKIKASYLATERLQIHGGIEHFQQFFSESVSLGERSVSLPLSAAYTEAQYFFTNRFTIKAGLRTEHQPNHSELMPRISSAYQLDEKQQVSVAFGSFRQNQNVAALVQNDELRPALSRHVLANYQWASEGRTIRAEIFHKHYEDLLQNTGPLSPTQTTGAGWAQGFDLFYRDQKSIKNMDYWVTYSYIHSRRRFGSYTELVQPSFAPQHNLSVVSKYWIEALNSQLGMSWQMNDGFAYDNPNLAGEQESKTSFFAALNLNWSYLPKPNLIIHVAVNNILGRQNVFGYNYAKEPGVNDQYASLAVGPPADRFFFVGVFITLSEDKKANQLNNL